MAEVDTSIYRQQGGGPFGQVQGAVNLLNTLQQNQLLGTANQQRQLELQSGYAKGLYDTIAPLVNSPGVTQAQVRAAAANYARQVGIPPEAHANFDAMLRGPDWQTNLRNLAIRATGPQNILHRQEIVDPKTGTKYAPPSPSLIGQGIVTGAPFGASVSPETSAKAGAGLESSATDTAQQRFSLNTLDRDLRVSGGKFGPTAGWEKKINQLGARFGGPITMTQEELGGLESFDKVVTTLADNMSRANGSDARLDAQFHSLPTSQGSAFGQSDIIQMLKGAGPDLTDAKRNIWFQYKKKNPQADFNQFNNDFNNEIDVRAFHLNNLEPKKRAAYLQSLSNEDRIDLAHKWADMYNNGVVIDGQKYKLPLIKRPTLE